jgi:hypothetical protein
VRAGEAGLALLLAIAFLLIMALITIALGNLTVSELATARSLDAGTRALAVADGAIERAIALLRLDPDWGATNGATKNLDTTGGSFKPLYDTVQGANAVNQAFPANASFATYTVEIKKGTTDPANNLWIRALGTYGNVSRAIEAYVHRLTPADMAVYSAGSYNAGSGGNGSTTFHGSAFFFSDALFKAGVQAGIYNDRPISMSDQPPYLNQLWVRGTLDTSKGNVNIGTQPQPMFGVHAGHINNPSKNIYTLEMDNVVPVINYPNVAGYITCLTGGVCPSNVTVQTPANIAANTQMGICKVTSTGPPVVYQYTTATDLQFDSTVYPNGFFVPAVGNGTCAAPSGSNYVLSWSPPSGGVSQLALNTATSNSPILVPGVVTAASSITYTGIGTIVVQNVNNASNAVNAGNGQILASNPASGTGTGNVLGCGSTAASSMPGTDLLGFIVAGSVTLQGNSTVCNQENDVVMVVGASPSNTFTATNKVTVFGMVITELLDTTQNPQFYQVPGLKTALPTPLLNMLSFTGPQPVVVRLWHELTPQE